MSAAPVTTGPAVRSMWDPVRVFAAVAIGTLVMLRATVFFAPQLVFDVDPVLDPMPIIGFGPAQSMLIDALLWLFSALGLVAEVRSRRRVDLLLMLLALGALPIVIWHGYADLGNLWLGVSWSAAIVAGMTVAHLARDRQIRILLIALVAAAITAILVRGLSQLLFEHARTVADFNMKRDAFLEAQGWSPDSAQAQVYIRRLEQNQPTGWFTTTNVLGSFAAAGLALWLSLAVGMWRHFGWRNVAFIVLSLLVLVAVAGAELLQTGSKGALGAGALGAAIVLVAHLLTARRTQWNLAGPAAHRLSALGGVAVLLLIAFAAFGIVARGTLMPEGALGEKSLLFRWFYMRASASMLADHLVPGVGPDKFQQVFLQHRPPRCPEEVTSAHNALLDWAVTLGMLGWTWIAFIVLCAWRAGARLLSDDDTPRGDGETMGASGSRAALVLVTASVMIAVGGSYIVESRAIDVMPLELWRGAGIIAALLIALLTMRAAMLVSRAVLSIGLAAAAVDVLVHAQIEVTLTQPGSAALAMVIIALAAPASAGSRRKIMLAVNLLLVLLAGWLITTGVVPAWRQQARMADAALELQPIALGERVRAEDVVAARVRAAATLRDAFEVLPTNPDPPFAAAEQLLAAAELETGERRVRRLREAIALAELSIDTVSLPSFHAIMASTHRALARTTSEEDAWLEAMSHAQALTRLDPNGIGAWKLYADICSEWDRDALAAQAYERVLEINANMALDPLKQLAPAEVAEIEKRLREVRASGEAEGG